MRKDDAYTWNEVLLSVRAFWAVRSYAGSLDTVSTVRMLDVARAYGQLSRADRTKLFKGVWLEWEPIPSAVIARMKNYLNGET